MKFNGVNHLAMATGDMDATIRFWRDLLGMRLVGGLGEPGFRHYFFEISKTDLIAFFEWPGVKPVEHKMHGRPVEGPFVFDHVSFGLDSPDELWELKDTLDAAGFNCSDVIDHGFIHSIYAFDPNGIPVEFSWTVEGRNIHTEPVMGDIEPTTLAKEGPEQQPGRWPEAENPTPKDQRRIYAGAGSELYHGKKQ
jgi:catechol 2,3-dioxygenase-like lactoylglutathione lyase family enzyme